ncbi:MAG: hypothetical protein JWR02_2856 [Mucilaginibacter sp.]|nr:hypothetical protein [Mucilaginibacter sp.]
MTCLKEYHACGNIFRCIIPERDTADTRDTRDTRDTPDTPDTTDTRDTVDTTDTPVILPGKAITGAIGSPYQIEYNTVRKPFSGSLSLAKNRVACFPGS